MINIMAIYRIYNEIKIIILKKIISNRRTNENAKLKFQI